MPRIDAPMVSEPDWAMRYPGDLLDGTGRREQRRLMDVGSGVMLSPVSSFNNRDDHIGVFVIHQHEDGNLCEGVVMFDVPANEGRPNLWQVQSWEPLTLTPSILRRDCGLHGFVTDGRWVGC